MTEPITEPNTEPATGTDPAAAACVLREGGVALVPTDTVYGLAASPAHPGAVRRIFEIKNRPATRNLPVMVSDPAGLVGLGVDLTAAAVRLLASDLMPGPVTLALGFAPDGAVPGWLAGRDEVAIRIPAHPWMRELLTIAGPLLVTSANVHAQATRESVAGILEQLTERPDVVVDGGTLSVVPSTLVNCRVQPPRIEREGAVPAGRIMEVIS
jgi:L-threonylcarbamoyladenylate synthase